MKRTAWLVLVLFSLRAFAVESVSTAPASSPPLLGVSTATASVFALATSVGAGAVALGLQGGCTAAFGQPRPLCAAGGVLLGGALQLALQALILPETFRISGLDPGVIRAGWWRWARWPAAALAISAVVLLAGSAAEQDRYGSAQGTMIGGLAGTVTTGLTLDVIGVIGAVRAAQQGR